MKRFSATVLALFALTVQSHADEAAVVTYEVDASFEDASLNVQDAIINRGLVVDYVARVGDMLNRTADDVGAERKVYASADVHIFCSATLSRKMMEADVTNVGHCPSPFKVVIHFFSSLAVETWGCFELGVRFGLGFFGPRLCFLNFARFTLPASCCNVRANVCVLIA